MPFLQRAHAAVLQRCIFFTTISLSFYWGVFLSAVSFLTVLQLCCASFFLLSKVHVASSLHISPSLSPRTASSTSLRPSCSYSRLHRCARIFLRIRFRRRGFVCARFRVAFPCFPPSFPPPFALLLVYLPMVLSPCMSVGIVTASRSTAYPAGPCLLRSSRNFE